MTMAAQSMIFCRLRHLGIPILTKNIHSDSDSGIAKGYHPKRKYNPTFFALPFQCLIIGAATLPTRSRGRAKCQPCVNDGSIEGTVRVYHQTHFSTVHSISMILSCPLSLETDCRHSFLQIFHPHPALGRQSFEITMGVKK